MTETPRIDEIGSDDLLRHQGGWKDVELRQAEQLEELRSEEAAVKNTEPADDEP
jgi:hypothetical protein